MDQRVKDFIEKNIDLIDEEDWYDVFFSWYTHWGSYDNIKDNKLLSNLFDVLKTAFPYVMFSSVDDRITIIQDALENYITSRASNPLAVTISCRAALQWLNSRLLLEVSTIEDLFIRAAANCGFTPDKTLTIYLKE